jgi:hypothetical protein
MGYKHSTREDWTKVKQYMHVKVLYCSTLSSLTLMCQLTNLILIYFYHEIW